MLKRIDIDMSLVFRAHAGFVGVHGISKPGPGLWTTSSEAEHRALRGDQNRAETFQKIHLLV